MKLVMKYYLSTATIFLLLIFSCPHEKSASSFEEYMRNHDLNYRKAEIAHAIELTLQLIDKIIEYKSEGVDGIDYDWMLLCSYSRLYLIHSKLGDERAAQNDLMKIKDIYERKEYSRAQISDEMQKLFDFVREIDSEHAVRWINE